MKPFKNRDDWNRIRSQLHWAGGYTQYRYGTIAVRETSGSVDARSRITLAGQKKQPPIFNKDKRAHLVTRIFDAMQDWRFSPFQYEGVTRSHIRSVLCLRGYGWGRSDAEAEYLVSEALKGYQRPSYNEGQPSYTASIFTCRGCGGPLDDYEVTHGVRHCSDECRRISKYRSTGLSGGFIQRGPAQCENPKCGKVFYPKDAFQKFCSRDCAVEGRALILPERQCAFCRMPFQPANNQALYCSPVCNQKMKDARGKEKRREARREQSCEYCSGRFTPKKQGARFCSERCQKNASYHRLKAAKAASDHPINKIFDDAA